MSLHYSARMRCAAGLALFFSLGLGLAAGISRPPDLLERNHLNPILLADCEQDISSRVLARAPVLKGKTGRGKSVVR